VVQVWQVVVLAAALGAANAVDIPARQASVVGMIEGNEDLISATRGVQAGLLGDRLGAPLTVGLGAAVCLIYGLFVAWRFPRVRRMA
jgi:hypothetical protein